MLLDEFKVSKGNSGPFFMFNVYEPGEEEVQEFKKKQRRKNRVKIGDDHWWTLAPRYTYSMGVCETVIVAEKVWLIGRGSTANRHGME